MFYTTSAPNHTFKPITTVLVNGEPFLGNYGEPVTGKIEVELFLVEKSWAFQRTLLSIETSLQPIMMELNMLTTWQWWRMAFQHQISILNPMESLWTGTFTVLSRTTDRFLTVASLQICIRQQSHCAGLEKWSPRPQLGPPLRNCRTWSCFRWNADWKRFQW